jgi:hypothetical protein
MFLNTNAKFDIIAPIKPEKESTKRSMISKPEEYLGQLAAKLRETHFNTNNFP